MCYNRKYNEWSGTSLAPGVTGSRKQPVSAISAALINGRHLLQGQNSEPSSSSRLQVRFVVHCNAEHSAEQLTIRHNLQLSTNNTRHSDTDVRHG